MNKAKIEKAFKHRNVQMKFAEVDGVLCAKYTHENHEMEFMLRSQIEDEPENVWWYELEDVDWRQFAHDCEVFLALPQEHRPEGARIYAVGSVLCAELAKKSIGAFSLGGFSYRLGEDVLSLPLIAFAGMYRLMKKHNTMRVYMARTKSGDVTLSIKIFKSEVDELPALELVQVSGTCVQENVGCTLRGTNLLEEKKGAYKVSVSFPPVRRSLARLHSSDASFHSKGYGECLYLHIFTFDKETGESIVQPYRYPQTREAAQQIKSLWVPMGVRSYSMIQNLHVRTLNLLTEGTEYVATIDGKYDPIIIRNPEKGHVLMVMSCRTYCRESVLSNYMSFYG